jgi:hypothetical protein
VPEAATPTCYHNVITERRCSDCIAQSWLSLCPSCGSDPSAKGSVPLRISPTRYPSVCQINARYWYLSSCIYSATCDVPLIVTCYSQLAPAAEQHGTDGLRQPVVFPTSEFSTASSITRSRSCFHNDCSGTAPGYRCVGGPTAAAQCRKHGDTGGSGPKAADVRRIYVSVVCK